MIISPPLRVYRNIEVVKESRFVPHCGKRSLCSRLELCCETV